VAEQPGTLELIGREVALALAPLEQRLSADADALVAELGVRLPGGFGAAATALSTAAVKTGELAPLVARLTDAIDDEDAARILSEGSALIAQLRAVVDAVNALGPALNAAVTGAVGISPAQRARLQADVQALPGRVLQFALVEHLRSKSAGTVTALALTGIVDDFPVAVDPVDATAPPYQRRALRFDRLLKLLTAPGDFLRDTFDLGNPGFDGTKLYARILKFLDEQDLPAVLLSPPGQPPALEAYLVRLATDAGTGPPSLDVRLRTPAAEDAHLSYAVGGPWTLSIDTTSRFEAGMEAKVRPPLAITLQPPSGSLALDITAVLAAERPGRNMLLLGQTSASRVEARRFVAALGVKGAAASGGSVTLEPTAGVELEGGRIFIDLSGGDGFIRAITGGLKIDSNFDLRALWSPSRGLLLEGSAAIEIALPTHISLGPIDVTTIYLRSGISGDDVPTELSGSFKAALGPIQASVDRIGVIAHLRFPAGGGSLGPADLGFEFKSPNGVGLAVDAGVVKGGGYLFIDEERGEYAGALELDFAGVVALKAIGIITTRMPDGSDGFSLLIVITAEFGTGIQLGFGFTLLAVGGVLGLHRSMALQPLVEGVRTNAISSVMFPHDVVANAPRIISDLRTFFPPEEGTFVIGPMAKLGWGTPTLVSLSLGIIIEIPGNVAIIGVLRVALPADQVAVIVLQVNFVGAIEFDRRRVYFFAALFDSRVLFLTIEGEMAVLAAFGDDADFVVSVGGFHPSFNPPPLPVPTPKRVAVDILNQPTQKLRAEGYFAVTTNTAQFGARVDARLGLDDCGVQGHLALDALLQFSPLHFVVTISASVELKVFGMGLFSVRLRFQLEGPAPWRAQGSASLSLLFFDIDVAFDITWGESRDTALPPVKAMEIVTGELNKPENWRGLPPPASNLLVSLRKLEAAKNTLVLHPVGVLRVSQRAVPLELTVDHVGNRKPEDVKRFSLGVATGGLAKRGDVLESFAPAQFQDFADAEKLSKPAFQDMKGGIDLSVSGEQMTSGAMVKRVIRYELITLDGAHRKHQRFFGLSVKLFTLFLDGAAIAKASISVYETTQRMPFAEKIIVHGNEFVVAAQADNKAVATFPSEAMAKEHLAQQHAFNPNLASTLHVIPAFEAVP
jgi:uncharacterized protein DUF6603